ncbi:MAG TPA: glycosyltransferase [Pseudohongiella sp.]|nr:glycosyltransferase [Pseudohongiella sp.]
MSPNNPLPRLTVSVVVYTLDLPVLRRCLESLLMSAAYAARQERLQSLALHLIDNGQNRAELSQLLDELEAPSELARCTSVLHAGHGNVGFGQAHNLVIHQSAENHEMPAENDIWLVLNPDVFLEAETLSTGIQWLQEHEQTVAVAPLIRDGRGHTVSACKRYPSVLDFLLRGFAPGFIRKRFKTRMKHYEMADLPMDRPTSDIPVISGCFMLFRHGALQQLQGFDPDYFLYFEDFDLSLRAHRLGTLTYMPLMVITHLGGRSARKGLSHIMMFARSGWRFFNTHGWRWI